ncbi:RNA polymerase subunit sigma-70 [Actinomycetes bacterium KLBMP 9759]
MAAAASSGDESDFTTLAERYRLELQVHCYRMLGSLDDAEDLVQETLLRAWHKRATYAGRSTIRAWMYRIATNLCLDFLDRQPLSRQAAVVPTATAPVPPVAVTWLQPYPDALLEPIAPSTDEPDNVVVARETIELAFMVAVQHLPPRQRAVLILRDVLGWSAKEAAAALDMSVAAANSGLQRARATIRQHLPERRMDWTATTEASEDERDLLNKFMVAIESADDAAIGALLREDARCSQQSGAGGHYAPGPIWYSGRDTLVAAWAPALHGPDALSFRLVAVRANRQPAVAVYIRAPGERNFVAFSLDVLTIEDGEITELTGFVPAMFRAFGLPATL